MIADPTLAAFDTHRALLQGIAYRMLGSVADAEDAVQETFLRWHETDRSTIREPKAWLTTVITRLCIDTLRSAQRRRETYVGPWLPEPVLTDQEGFDDPAELADSLSIALLAVLERLGPVERAAFLLREVFGYPYEDVARIIDKTETNCRQLVRRARTHLAAERPRFPVDRAATERLAQAFAVAARSGAVEPLLEIFADDITLYSDGGGKAQAATRPVRGALNVARFVAGIAQRSPADARFVPREINGSPGFVGLVDGEPVVSVFFDVWEDRIRGLYMTRNPDKLHGMRLTA